MTDIIEQLAAALLEARQFMSGWKQGCAAGEWSDYDEKVLQRVTAAVELGRKANTLPSDKPHDVTKGEGQP